ncbi:YifB family Mg chelatase-like AAA ATPase [Candidatus Latescibacterota bacterium]
MFARVFSAAVQGIDAYVVEVETDLDFKLPAFKIVGLAEGAVVESRERVSSAIKNADHYFPQKRVTINLAPADKRKEGAAFDLPAAVGILAADGVIPQEPLERFVMVGELSLDGVVRPVPGVLPIALMVREAGFDRMIVPSENAGEAALVKGVEVYPVKSLTEVIEFLSGRQVIAPHRISDPLALTPVHPDDIDFSDVRGQAQVKRALEVAVAGGHNILMIGPPGSGKTMMARRIPTIFPAMTMEEAIETTKIHSVAGILKNGKYLVTNRPFRAPHHTTTEVALVGGGSSPNPGEVSMAHNGVLFIDEMPELGRSTIEALRQPLEDGIVSISRALYSVTYPANFMLVAAMNPCPCGFLTDPMRECTCPPGAIQRYFARISGPILDRIDIHVEVPAVRYRDLAESGSAQETSATIHTRVNRARTVQRDRYRDAKGIYANAQLGSRALRQFCSLDGDGERMLRRAIDSFGFSARAYHRILKVARTIADLDGEAFIAARHVAEAIQYRTLDRNLRM